MKDWWLDTSGSVYVLGFFMLLLSWVGWFWWSVAFYLSVRASVPKFVSTKNTLGLFSFTFLVFETYVITLLLWFLYFLLWYTDSARVCAFGSYFCEGLVQGTYVFLNTLAVLVTIVLFNVRKKLGIGIWDALGMSV